MKCNLPIPSASWSNIRGCCRRVVCPFWLTGTQRVCQRTLPWRSTGVQSNYIREQKYVSNSNVSSGWNQEIQIASGSSEVSWYRPVSLCNKAGERSRQLAILHARWRQHPWTTCQDRTLHFTKIDLNLGGQMWYSKWWLQKTERCLKRNIRTNMHILTQPQPVRRDAAF